MGLKYSHLSQAERWDIENKRRAGLSHAAIARALGGQRHRSTVWRESRRGHWHGVNRYLAEFGQRFYARKRAEAGRCRRKLDALMLKPAWKTVLFGLRQDWSPRRGHAR